MSLFRRPVPKLIDSLSLGLSPSLMTEFFNIPTCGAPHSSYRQVVSMLFLTLARSTGAYILELDVNSDTSSDNAELYARSGKKAIVAKSAGRASCCGTSTRLTAAKPA